jgi:hypothetical protein
MAAETVRNRRVAADSDGDVRGDVKEPTADLTGTKARALPTVNVTALNEANRCVETTVNLLLTGSGADDCERVDALSIAQRLRSSLLTVRFTWTTANSTGTGARARHFAYETVPGSSFAAPVLAWMSERLSAAARGGLASGSARVTTLRLGLKLPLRTGDRYAAVTMRELQRTERRVSDPMVVASLLATFERHYHSAKMQAPAVSNAADTAGPAGAGVTDPLSDQHARGTLYDMETARTAYADLFVGTAPTSRDYSAAFRMAGSGGGNAQRSRGPLLVAVLLVSTVLLALCGYLFWLWSRPPGTFGAGAGAGAAAEPSPLSTIAALTGGLIDLRAQHDPDDDNGGRTPIRHVLLIAVFMLSGMLFVGAAMGLIVSLLADVSEDTPPLPFSETFVETAAQRRRAKHEPRSE